MTEDKKNKEEELKELVVARIKVMPPEYKLSVGDKGTFDKEQLIYHVNKGDDTGHQIIAMQMNFIKALSSGKLIKALNK